MSNLDCPTIIFQSQNLYFTLYEDLEEYYNMRKFSLKGDFLGLSFPHGF